MKEVNCLFCNKSFNTYPSHVKNGRGKFCSRICKGKYYPIWNKGIKTGQKVWDKGIKRKDIEGENHPHWLGDNVGYQGVHTWIRKVLGKPNKCEFCVTSDKRYYDWANRDGKYRRRIEDYIRLCRSCHKKYDNQRRFLYA